MNPSSSPANPLLRRAAAGILRTEIVDAAYRGLLDRIPDPEGAAAYGRTLTRRAGVLEVLGDIGRSDELWQRLVARHAVALAADLLAGLTGTKDRPTAHEPQRLAEALGATADFAALGRRLAESDSWRSLAMASLHPVLVDAVYAGLLGRQPTTAEKRQAMDDGASPDALRRLVERLAATQLPAFPAALPAADAPLPLLGRAGDAADPATPSGTAGLLLQDGFYDADDAFVWAADGASMQVSGPVTIGLSCNYLKLLETRTILVTEGLREHRVVLEDCETLKSIVVGRHGGQVRLVADGVWTPADDGLEDRRALAFQLWFDLRGQSAIPVASRSTGRLPVITAAHESKKELDSLLPIVAGLRDYGFTVDLIDTGDVGRRWQQEPSSNAVFLIASGSTFRRLNHAGCKGRFIYAEHGTAPLKRYTYAFHYARYDLILLPGTLWSERLGRLAPRLAPRIRTVGYPKLHGGDALDADRRRERCLKLGLDPTRPVILFAPSWSGGDRACGIFNLEHFGHERNLLCIAHDGDMPFAPEFVALGYRVVRPGEGESISDFYALADILVSDVSSTAIEFAALGGAVISLLPERLPDFDPRFREADGRVRIPMTDRYWDFCPTVRPEAIAAALDECLARGWRDADARAIAERVRPLVDCHGRDAVRRCVAAISEFCLET